MVYILNMELDKRFKIVYSFPTDRNESGLWTMIKYELDLWYHKYNRMDVI